MPILPFSEYRPDVSAYMAAASQVVSNVVPRADGYGPFSAFVAYTAALPAACRGFFYARNTDGTITVFAGTSTRLFKLDNTTVTWVPVSNFTAVTSISNASPAVVALTAHGLSIGDAVVFSTTGALPTGLTAGTVYYVIAAGFTANAFEVSATLGGAAINTSSAGSGTHSVTTQYAALPTANHWQFAQFGSVVIAVQPNVVPQAFTIGTSSAFAALGGSPPQAAYVSVVGRFIVLSGLLSTPYRVHWSGLNAITTWTSGVSSSDFQDLPDGGTVVGVAGGEYGVIFQQSAMRRMIYVPGSPVIFNLERVTEDKGLLAPYSLIRAGENVFFLAPQGFHRLSAVGLPEAIGKERFDRTFFADYDSSALQMVIGAADPAASRVYWAYRSGGGSAGLFDKLLCYDYQLDRASVITASGEYLASLAAPGATLESLDSISGSLDALPFSLDDVSSAALSKLSAANSSHMIGFFAGANLEATLDTSEQTLERRARVKGFRPVTDADGCYGAVGGRENLQSSVTYSTEQLVNVRGLVPANVSTRMARGRVRIPAATSWTFATGVEPDFAPEGKR